MKFRVVLFVLALISFGGGCATHQFVPNETASVVEVSGKSQQEIFDKTRQWFSQYFVSGESVIDYENREVGTIIGNGVAKIGTDPFGLINYRIHYNIKIDTKDGKFRSTTKILKHTNTDSSSTYDVTYVSEEREVNAAAHIDKIVADIKTYIVKQTDPDNSNW